MNIEEISKRIAELHYHNKPNSIIDEPYRQVRMETLKKQVETELKNCFIPTIVEQSEKCCSPTDGFYLGTTCPHCNKSFRKNIK